MDLIKSRAAGFIKLSLPSASGSTVRFSPIFESDLRDAALLCITVGSLNDELLFIEVFWLIIDSREAATVRSLPIADLLSGLRLSNGDFINSEEFMPF